MTNYQAFFERRKSELTGRGLWLRGGELNTLARAAADERPFRVLFSRLSTYADTASSYTHLLLYGLAARLPGVFPDLAYLPPPRDAALFESENVPWLLGTQTHWGPKSFQVIGFSNSVLQELVNLPVMIEKSGLPLSKKERLRDPSVPLLLLGGANAIHTTALWNGNPWVDGIFIGDRPEDIRTLIGICRDGHRDGIDKQELLARLSERIPGFLEPDRVPEKIEKGRWSGFDDEDLTAAPVPFASDALGSAPGMITHGCPCFCSFCSESWNHKPFHWREVDEIQEQALKQKAARGSEEIDISSFNFNLHPEIYPLLSALARNFSKIGLKSQRMDVVAHEPRTIDIQKALGKSTFTIGLEGISDRLRSYLNKSIGPDELKKALAALLTPGTRELKIFLIATGLEQTSDFEEFGRFLKEIQTLRQRAAGTRVIFSMTPLVRFPWTPLEFEPAPLPEAYESVIRRTAGLVQQSRFEFREASPSSDALVSQLLARADQPQYAEALLATIRATQTLYYREIPPRFGQVFVEELDKRGIRLGEALRGYSLEESLQKPWSRLDLSISRPMLFKQTLANRQFEDLNYCLGRPWKRTACRACGACPDEESRARIISRPRSSVLPLPELQRKLKAAQEDESKLFFQIEVSASCIGVPNRVIALALARAVMLSEPALAAGYRGTGPSLWAEEDRPVQVIGRDQVTLFWSSAAASRLLELADGPAFLSSLQNHLSPWASWVSVSREPLREVPRFFRFLASTPEHDAGITPDPYLAAQGLKYSLRRLNAGALLYELAPASLKKGFLKALWVVTEKRPEIHVHAGDKFQPADLIHNLEGSAKNKGFQLIAEASEKAPEPLTRLASQERI